MVELFRLPLTLDNHHGKLIKIKQPAHPATVCVFRPERAVSYTDTRPKDLGKIGVGTLTLGMTAFQQFDKYGNTLDQACLSSHRMNTRSLSRETPELLPRLVFGAGLLLIINKTIFSPTK